MNGSNQQDFSNFLPRAKPTKKEELIEECKKLNVSPYIDDSGETSSGVYSEMRAVASEAEIERRLIAKRSMLSAEHSKYISIIAIVIALISLVKSFW
ncbi:MAG: hypothetical protein RRB22_04225 [Gammaproteobacteria bacterium]|nr:hypothetical protein [Gammaproteobacteria bacterium]